MGATFSFNSLSLTHTPILTLLPTRCTLSLSLSLSLTHTHPFSLFYLLDAPSLSLARSLIWTEDHVGTSLRFLPVEVHSIDCRYFITTTTIKTNSICLNSFFLLSLSLSFLLFCCQIFCFCSEPLIF